MYDKHIIYPGSLRNRAEGDGYTVGVRLPYYRAQPLSIVENIALSVGGVFVPRENVRVSMRGKTWSLDQLDEQTTERWEFGEVADVSVLHPGGLAPGPHEIAVGVQLRISYLPWSPVTSCTRNETIHD